MPFKAQMHSEQTYVHPESPNASIRLKDSAELLGMLRRLVEDKRIRKIFEFANNHCGARTRDSEHFWELGSTN